MLIKRSGTGHLIIKTEHVYVTEDFSPEVQEAFSQLFDLATLALHLTRNSSLSTTNPVECDLLETKAKKLGM